MLREIDERQIRPERLMRSSDMARIGCSDCAGCSQCCKNRGSVIVLDAFDVKMLKEAFACSFEELIRRGYISLTVVDAVVLPGLALKKEKDECLFLNEEGRCSIHPFRPGICRMFPLARLYSEDGSFSYFIQEGECSRCSGEKIKISKWLGYPDIRAYEKEVGRFHEELKSLRDQCSRPDITREKITALQSTFLKEQYIIGI